MALIGTPTLLLFGALAVGLPVACVYLWPRVPGPPALRTAGRLGLVLCCQLAALLVAGVAINNYGAFYTSWSELLHAGTGGGVSVATTQIRHFGAADLGPALGARPDPAPNGTARLTPDTWTALPWSKRADWPTRGAIVSTTLGGGRSGLSEPVWVYLPPAYFGDGPAARDLPVVEALSGYPGHQRNLVDRLHYPDLVLDGIRSGQVDPMVLVMMRPVPNYPWDTECTDVPDGPQAFTYFADDVPAAAVAAFGLHPPAYGVIGDSTGGYCAAKLAMLAPERFPAAVALSGYFHAATDRTTHGIFKGRPALRDQNDLRWRLRNLPAPRTSVLVATSADAPGNDGYAAAQEFLALVRPPMSADETVLAHGGHNFETWVRQLPYALSWLSRHLSGAASQATAPPTSATAGTSTAPGTTGRSTMMTAAPTSRAATSFATVISPPLSLVTRTRTP